MMERKELREWTIDEFTEEKVYLKVEADAVMDGLEAEIIKLKSELLLEKAENAELHEDMLHQEHPEYLYPTPEEEKWNSIAQSYRNEAKSMLQR